MNPFTDNETVNTYLKERIETLPPELKSAIADPNTFGAVDTVLSTFATTDEVKENIKYEIFLILVRLSPLEDLLPVLISQYDFLPETALEISQEIEMILSKYQPYITDISDDEQGGNAPQQPETTPLHPEVLQSSAVAPQELSSVPRYAKPLTDLPRYNDNQQ